MIQVAILTRRLKEGKTYEDFRKASYHTVGFGTGNKMYTVINVFDPREILVIGFTETTLEQFKSELKIDVKERLEHSLDDVIEPSIGRQFGLLVSEDDFSAEGAIDYRPPSVHGGSGSFPCLFSRRDFDDQVAVIRLFPYGMPFSAGGQFEKAQRHSGYNRVQAGVLEPETQTALQPLDIPHVA